MAKTSQKRDGVWTGESESLGGIHVNERLLHGGGDTFMTVRHLVIRGSNASIGQELAQLAAERHAVTAALLSEQDPGHACGQTAFIMQHAPILWARAQGVARGLNLDLATCDATSLPYNQLPPGLRGPRCSLVYYPPAVTHTGHPMLSRNYDFPKITSADLLDIDVPESIRRGLQPLMAEPYLLELHPTDGGYSSMAMVCFDLLAGVLDGVNSEGVMVAVNGDEIAAREGFLPDPHAIGFHELSCMRAVLDQCASLGEAKEILSSADVRPAMMPCHYLVADRHGRAAVVEYDAEGGVHFLDAANEPLVMTNHPLHRYPGVDAFPVPHDFLATGTSTFDRYVHLDEAVQRTPGDHRAADMTQACELVTVGRVLTWLPEPARADVAQSPGLSRTLWHALYDAEERDLSIRFYQGEEPLEAGGFLERFSSAHMLRLNP